MPAKNQNDNTKSIWCKINLIFGSHTICVFTLEHYMTSVYGVDNNKIELLCTSSDRITSSTKQATTCSEI